jgi:hypothetical protein
MSKKALLFTALTAGLCLTVSLPLGFIVGVMVIVPTNVTTGMIAGVLASLIFTAWATYASYQWNSQAHGGDAAAA